MDLNPKLASAHPYLHPQGGTWCPGLVLDEVVGWTLADRPCLADQPMELLQSLASRMSPLHPDSLALMMG